MADTAPPAHDTVELEQGLTLEEDDELRRLNYLQSIGCLGPFKAERLIELRLRDRRAEIRPPREFNAEEERPQAAKAGRGFLARLKR